MITVDGLTGYIVSDGVAVIVNPADGEALISRIKSTDNGTYTAVGNGLTVDMTADGLARIQSATTSLDVLIAALAV